MRRTKTVQLPVQALGGWRVLWVSGFQRETVGSSSKTGVGMP